MKPSTLLPANLAVLLLLLATPAWSQNQMNYQGRLTDNSGNALPDGQQTITFTLWSAASGGTQVWGPYIADGSAAAGHGPFATLVNGRFNTLIGPVDTANRQLTTAFVGGGAAPERYLQIQVATNAAIQPRQKLLAAPAAIYATHATTADTAANFTSNVLKTDEINLRVGVGTATPGAKLEISNGTTSLQVHPGLLNGTADANAVTFDIPGTTGTIGIWDKLNVFSSASLDSVHVTNKASAAVMQARGTVTTHDQGAYMEWNRWLQGETNFNNHKGTGTGGFTWNEVDNGNNYTERMKIDGAGNLDLGNLNIYVNSHFGAASPNAVTLDIPGTTGSIDIWDNLEVNANCYVNAGIFRNLGGNWASLEDNGGSNRWAYWSDARLKKDIVPLTGALDTIARLRGVSYQWTDDGLAYLTRNIEKSWRSKSGTEADNKKLWAEKRAEAEKPLRKRQTGFIAQELEKVFPEWVTTDDKGFKQIDTHNMAAVLVQGINELAAQNKDQAATLAALQKENAALKAELATQAAKDKAQDDKLTALAALIEKSASAATTAKVSTAAAKR